ncbi:MAG: alkaline phosphatase family protein [Gemmatimonadetes bacterium]|nr:alkaline phosphatase family protein [Gemmatimonadota bacterium]
MTRIPRGVLGLTLTIAAAALLPGCQRAAQEERPALIVLIAVDQLRADLLERYDSLFTGGLRRLMDQGRYYASGVHDHAGTETAPGHATLATGVFPSRHGIVQNDWDEKVAAGWRTVYNTADTTERIVGMPAQEGRSPRNLLREGLADWVAAADTAALIVSISGKDRSAILLGGKVRGHVYWFADTGGRFATSTYYRAEYPLWLDRFHREWVEPLTTDTVWASSVPAAAAALTRRDTVPYEGDGAHTYFPHRFSEEGRGGTATDYFRWFARTPFLDAATLALARTAVEALALGKDPATDLLAVGLSQTDRVGHDYGPLSREQLDNLLRVDRELGEFLGFLDQAVGEGRYVLALSADHGVATVPEYLQELGRPGRRVLYGEVAAVMKAIERAAAGPDTADAADRIAAAVERFDFVADAVPYHELAGGEPADSFITLFQHSYHPGRLTPPLGRFGIEVRLTEGTIISDRRTGTGHGSPYLYDRHVPVLLLGPGVVPGRSSEHVRTVDVAPTLARLAGVPVPGDLDGRALVP